MSLIGDAVAPYALISSPIRAIDMIMPHVVVEEVHTDDLAITDHPVEIGAAISDHAFLLPARVQMRCGWSNSTAMTEGYVQEVYAQLLALQKLREPFTVYTGKRIYENMLLGRIAVQTNEQFENALMVSADLREVILTRTQASGPARAAQAMPQKTAPSTDNGRVRLTPPLPGVLGKLTRSGDADLPPGSFDLLGLKPGESPF